jgi:hypothetical protein
MSERRGRAPPLPTRIALIIKAAQLFRHEKPNPSVCSVVHPEASFAMVPACGLSADPRGRNTRSRSTPPACAIRPHVHQNERARDFLYIAGPRRADSDGAAAAAFDSAASPVAAARTCSVGVQADADAASTAAVAAALPPVFASFSCDSSSSAASWMPKRLR